MSEDPSALLRILSVSLAIFYRAVFYRYSRPNPNEKMQSKRFVRVVIWVIVVAMVIGLLGLTAATFFR